MSSAATVREQTEEFERAAASTWATLSAESKGRDRHEEPDALRTSFQVDRERIVGSAAFGQLQGKSLSLLLPPDLQRSCRLAHTLQVADLARTAARALRLNEDLVEAIALAHDIGHGPFGDADAAALSLFTDQDFDHAEHGVRVVEVLERGGAGLNLTWEVRDGILHHTAFAPQPATAEGQLVRVAARIVRAGSDLAEAFTAGLLSAAELPEAVRAYGATRGRRTALLLDDLLTTTADHPEVRLSGDADAALTALHDLLEARMRDEPRIQAERARAVHCLASLVTFLLENHEHGPVALSVTPHPAQAAVDAVAAMADAQALDRFDRWFLPQRP